MTELTTGFCIQRAVVQTLDKGSGTVAAEAVAKGAVVWRFVPGADAIFDEDRFRAAILGMTEADVAHGLSHVFGMTDFPGCLVKILDDGVLINHSATSNVATNLAGVPAVVSPDPSLEDVEEALLSEPLPAD